MQVENFQKLMDTVAQINEQGRKAVKATVRDVKARAPSWIAQEVTSVYNIKKGEITPSGKNSSKPKKMAGSVSVSGETIEELTITYSGRLLTPVHFGMTPKTAPPGKSYTLRMQVVKGQKKVIGRYLNTRTPGGPYSERSHNILMGTGNTKAGGVSAIPFQRMSRTRTDIKKFTTISVPSMITATTTPRSHRPKPPASSRTCSSSWPCPAPAASGRTASSSFRAKPTTAAAPASQSKARR